MIQQAYVFRPRYGSGKHLHQWSRSARLGMIETGPLHLTRFVGREREIAEVRKLLGDNRLVTLTGAGGIGKTRLAERVAEQAAAVYPDGVAWVELAPITHPELIPQQLASSLGVREKDGRPLLDVVIADIRKQSLLLVLDNCEHLVEGCATVAEALLRGCSDLAILATSREALGVGGERAWLVPPLSLPPIDSASPQDLAQSEAALLFLERARDVLPSFGFADGNVAAVVEICRRLDGLPLAIELAAARVKLLAPAQIARRLDNAFSLLVGGGRTTVPRHRALRAAVDWSYQLLSAAEQTLLQRLAVFAGGFTLEAAEDVCSAGDIRPEKVLDLLSNLVDKSLVVIQDRSDTVRYTLQEAVRQFGLERLGNSQEESLCRKRHAEFFFALVDAALPHLMRASARTWPERLLLEHDNFRAALDWANENAAELAVGLVGRLWWLWGQTSFWTEGVRWTESMSARADIATPAIDRARVLHGAGAFAYMFGDSDRAMGLLRESEALWRSLDRVMPEYLLMLGTYTHVLASRRESDAALAKLDEAVRLARELGEPWVLAHVLVSGAGIVHMGRGDFDTAERYLTEAQETAHVAGLSWGVAEAAKWRGRIALERGQTGRAAQHAADLVSIAQQLSDPMQASGALLLCSSIAAARREYALAARLLGAGETVRRVLGSQLLPHERAEETALLERVESSLADATFQTAVSEGRALGLAEALALASVTLGGGVEQAVTPSSVTPAAGALEPTPDLEVLALGPLEIYRGGEALSAAAWQYAKPRELLLYLLCHPRGRTRDQIALAFWPNASTAQVRNSFHVALHRLRKVLGDADWIVLDRDRYRVTSDRSVVFDAVRMERDMSSALQDRRAPDIMSRLEGALQLYRGDFLESEPVGDWHLQYRDRLRRLYVDGGMALAELHYDADRLAEAADVCERVLRWETLHEAAYRLLMICWTKMGDRTRALRLYQRLSTLLKDELETEPESETAAVYERLQRNEIA